MFRIDDATAATSLPAPETVGTEGYFTEGNPAAGTPATNVRGSWLNMIQEELRAIVVAAGLTPKKGTNNQVLSAISILTSGVVGQARNAKMTIAAASATGTFTADEVIVESALGGLRFCLASVNKTINLATVGAGGMDTGAAPASGFVGVYVIYNPSSSTSALLSVNATAASVPEVYGGANMPAGYTASALVAVLSTNGSAQLNIQTLTGRTVKIPNLSLFSDATSFPSYAAISTPAIPRNAVAAYVMPFVGNAANSVMSLRLAGMIAGVGEVNVGGYVQGATTIYSINVSPTAVPMTTPQTLYRQNAATPTGTPTFAATLIGWSF